MCGVSSMSVDSDTSVNTRSVSAARLRSRSASQLTNVDNSDIEGDFEAGCSSMMSAVNDNAKS